MKYLEFIIFDAHIVRQQIVLFVVTLSSVKMLHDSFNKYLKWLHKKDATLTG